MTQLADAAIRFEPDAFDMNRPRLMGRQSAGAGFLRAAVAGRLGEEVVGYGPNRQSSAMFAAMVGQVDPAAPARWMSLSQVHDFGKIGVCQLPHPALGAEARLRLRAGLANHSLCGVTHTVSSDRTMEALARLLCEPLTPWDAVICTSSAVAETIRRVHEAEADYLKWRFGVGVMIARPQTPVIPLGVHCQDYAFSEVERATARAELGIGEGEVVALYVGRLAITAKAHPFQMYRGLQAAQARTGASVTLLQCGWAENPTTEQAFHRAPREHCPSVRAELIDGRDAVARRRCWAAADIFVSLADSIQETYGLTPVEAMAAGLPCLVSDWDGYRDTVRDGVDGFRIRTWAPAAGMGGPLPLLYEAGEVDFSLYSWGAAATTSVDLEVLTDRLATLIGDADLRRRLGEAGRQRAHEVFDWAVVFRQYQALWGELNARREAAKANPEETARLAAAPRSAAQALDPFHAFGHYPSSPIDRSTTVALRPGATPADHQRLKADILFTGTIDRPQVVAKIFAYLEEVGPASVLEIARVMSAPEPLVVHTLGILAKMGLVELS
jgi:starch synthase